MFDALASIMVRSAKVLDELFNEPNRLDVFAAQIKTLEHEGDVITHEVMNRIDKSFVTPLDREDLHALCSAVDSVLDVAESCANRVVIYHAASLTEPMKELVRIYQEAVTHVWKCVCLLSDLSKIEVINTHFVHVNTLENEGDKVYREALSQLFAKAPTDVVEFIRQKEILDALERAIDATEDVMDLMRSVCVKNG
jgi:predicted phosphate transport protein (TIGR00153 family)